MDSDALRETSHPALFYQEMLADQPRMARYREAIVAVVKPGDVVVDLGTGLGVLAIMAAQAGARKVYAIDARERVVPYARAVIEANGFSGVIDVLCQDASKPDLPESVDVIVNELIGDFGTDENIYECVKATADKYLKPGGRVVPRNMQTCLVGVAYTDEFRGVYRDAYHGLDLRAAIEATPDFSPSAVMYGLRNQPLELTNVAVVEDMDFEQPLPPRRYVHDVVLDVIESGSLQGLVGFFRSELTEGISLSNYPRYESCHWINWHWPMTPPLQVASGQTIEGCLLTPEKNLASVWQWQATSA